jgi:hypothetical protein
MCAGAPNVLETRPYVTVDMTGMYGPSRPWYP